MYFFLFQGHLLTEIDRGFFEDYYFPIYDETQLWNHTNGVTSGHRNRPVKAPEGSLDLKPPYIKVSDASRERVARISRNTEILPEPATIGGELSSIAAKGEISTPPRSRTSSP